MHPEQLEKEASRKSKPRYLGPMVVIWQTKGGSYILAELDGMVLATRFAAFQIIPYFPHTKMSLSSIDFGSSSDTIPENVEPNMMRLANKAANLVNR